MVEGGCVWGCVAGLEKPWSFLSRVDKALVRDLESSLGRTSLIKKIVDKRQEVEHPSIHMH